MGDLRFAIPGDLESFREESKRLESFANWPRSAGAQPAALSRAGFYYTGERQRAACAFCYVIIEDWTFADQAIAKHRERSPNCPFVLRAYDRSQIHTAAPTSSSPLLRESERRKTFEGWPVTFVSPEDLARAGFIYLKHDDRVQCVFCHGIVGAWEEGDVPWVEHQRHFKNCPFVLRRTDIGNVPIEDEYGDRQALQPQSAMSSRGYDVVGTRTVVSGSRPERRDTAANQTKGTLTNDDLNILHHSPAKNPNYKNKEARLRTFTDWPSSLRQDPETLAEAGFFYTGVSDHVKCFHCNGGLRNWEPNDSPWEEHARWFHNCEFISLHKGKEFIEASMQRKSGASNSKPTTSNLKQNGASAAEQQMVNANGIHEVSEAELDELMRSEVAQQALELNLEPQQIRQAMKRRMSHAGYPFADAESLANAVLDLEKHNGRALQMEGESKVRRSMSLADLPMTANVDLHSMAATTMTNGTTRSGTAMEEDPRLCKICWDKDVCVVFLPCGHLVSCAECSSSLKDCPFCRQQIKGTVRTYWP